MFCVARDQAMLKQQAGRDARGRKNTKPVLHYSLSWAISDNPSPEHMRATALSSLKALSLLEHQVLMAAHGDKEHLHVHIVVNTVHPDTGLTAPLKYTKERLSRWAEAYEREHGIHCEERIRNNAERARLKAERESSRFAEPTDSANRNEAPYVAVKHRARNRKQWLERQDIIDRMKRHSAELDRRHLTERDVTWARHRQEFAALMETTKKATDNARRHVSDQYRRRWRALYAAQRKEMRQVTSKESHIFERAVYVFVNSERLGSGKALTMKRKLQLILSPKKLEDAVGRMQRRERNRLAQVQKADTHELVERAWRAHEPRFEALKTRHAAERSAERLQQAEVARRSVGFLRAKNELILEREYGRPVRMAADAPPFETDQAYVARIRAERQAFYDRQRRPDTPSRSLPPPTPVTLDQPCNDSGPSSSAIPFNETAGPQAGDRAAGIRRDMEEWRRKNRGRDFGRELDP
jgi:hypothetical protein